MCDYPSDEEVLVARLLMPHIVVTPDTATYIPDNWVLLDEATSEVNALAAQVYGGPAFTEIGQQYLDDAQDLIASGAAVLRKNADLVEWAVCLATDPQRLPSTAFRRPGARTRPVVRPTSSRTTTRSATSTNLRTWPTSRKGWAA